MKRPYLHFAAILALVLFLPSMMQGNTHRVTERFTGTDIAATNMIYIEDPEYTAMQTPATWDFINHRVVNTVALGVDEFYQGSVSGYSDITFALSVDLFDESGANFSTESVSLTINPNTSQTGSKRQLHLWYAQDAHRMEVTISSVLMGGSPVTAPVNVFIELGVEVERYFDVSEPLPTISNLHHQLLDYDPIASAPTIVTTPVPGTVYSADEIEILWDITDGAEYYELEWTWINNYDAQASQYLTAAQVNLTDQGFAQNCSRISTTANQYSIPLIYDRGFLVYRLRPVFSGGSDFTRKVDGVWSSGTGNTHIDDYDPHYQLMAGHQLNKNWQLSVSFAEEGKKKEMISYFDGTKRARQSVTRNNTDYEAIVAETFYDHQGRPAVQVLPAPASEEINYYEGFSKNALGAPYSRADFDIDLGTDCSNESAPPLALDILLGTAKYYSSLNDRGGIHDYLPDASGYVFTQTEYEPDNTSRVRRQSGVGYHHRLGSGHETRYYYVTPDQEELDRLFGTNVGYASHYKKNVVIDPNGQFSLTYMNLKGSVIATALSGDHASNLEPLTDENGIPLDQGGGGTVEIDMLNKGTGTVDTDRDNNHISSSGKSLEMNYSFVYPKQDDFSATYDLDIAPFTDNCFSEFIGYEPVMDLRIRVTSTDCLDIIYDWGGTIGSADTLETGATVNFTHNVPAQNDLPAGSYRVEKVLTVNEAALDYYAEKYLDHGACLIPYQEFLDSAWNELDTTDCDTSLIYDCDACVAELGLASDFLTNGGTQAEWDALVESCQAPCTYTSFCDLVLDAMLKDVSPGGQYGQYQVSDAGVFSSDDPLSLFNPSGKLPAYPGSFPGGTPGETIEEWDPAWAYDLVTYHPEYCYFEAFCNDQQAKADPISENISSEEYDWTVQNTFTYDAAEEVNYREILSSGLDLVSGWSSTNFPILDYDPYPFSGGQLSEMQSLLQNFKGSGYSLYEYVSRVVQCGNWFGNNGGSCTYSGFGSHADQTVRDKEWNMLKSLYLSTKQEYLFRAVTVEALNIASILSSSGEGCFNGCIGVSDYNPLSYLHNILFGGDFPVSVSQSDMMDIVDGQQVCGANYRLYADKQRRMHFYDEYAEDAGQSMTQEEADQEVYSQTGLCPLAIDLKLFVENVLTAQLVDQPALPVLYIDGFTADLYLEVTGFSQVGAQNYAIYEWEATAVSSERVEGNLNLTNTVGAAASVSNFLILEFSTNSPFNWSDLGSSFEVTRVRRLVPNGQNSSGYYGFAVEVDILDNTGEEHVEVLTGQVKNIDLQGCEGTFSETAHRNEYARDLENVFNLLAAQGQFNSSNIDLESGVYEAAFTGSSIETTLDPDDLVSASFKWNKATTAQFNMASSGSDRQFRVFFCSEPSGAGFASGFADVDFFRNLEPLDPAGGPYCTANGYEATFQVEAINVNYTTGAITNTFILYGYADFYDNVSPTPVVHDIALGGFGSFASGDKEDCEARNVTRLELLDFINAVLPADYNSLVYSPGGYDDLTAGLRVQLGEAIQLPEYQTALGGDIYYIGVEVAGDEDHYVGLFYDGHDPLINLSPPHDYSITGSEEEGYHIQIDPFKQGGAYGYFPCEIKMKFSDPNASYDFSDIISITDLRPKPGTLLGGKTRQFVAVAHMTSEEIFLIEGESCFEFSSGCTDCVTPAPDVPVNCWDEVTVYNDQIVAVVDGLDALTEEEFCEQNVAHCLPAYLTYFEAMGFADVETPYYISLTDFCNGGMGFYLSAYLTYLRTELGIGENDDIFTYLPDPFNEEFLLLGEFAAAGIGPNCVTAYVNEVPGIDIRAYCLQRDPEYPCKIMNFQPFPAFEADQNPCVEFYTDLAQFNASQAYETYTTQIKDDFKQLYVDHCISTSIEEFTRSGEGTADYQFMLYYYDQAGNLVKTVPPRAVEPLITPGLVPGYRESGQEYTPAHTGSALATTYVYNTLNQVVEQTTPDGGTTRFWYDRAGRLVASQNAEQANNDEYSYTRYDALGRIVETGQLISTEEPATLLLNSYNFPDNWETSREEVSHTFYDEVALSDAESYYYSLDNSFALENLRNRVSATAYYENFTGDFDEYNYATHYSYDEHGNVKTLVQDKRQYFSFPQQRFKRIDYAYDLVSGNVKEVAYQQNAVFDQLFHRYEYDADNRITSVLTSKDGLIWDEDAEYGYYAHGPLARTELGEFQVQGMDYAYTLQGWLKAMNSSTLERYRDMGRDGISLNNHTSRDAYAYSLHYFNGDYTPIGAESGAMLADVAGMGLAGLYNGNIAGAVQSIWETSENPMRTHGNRYRYDQLNRLKEMQVYHRTVVGIDHVLENNTFSNAIATDDYRVELDYDANGNITHLTRNGYGAVNTYMDDLNYAYPAGNNKLRNVTESNTGSAGYYSADIDHQTDADNYDYDDIGNLISDIAEEIAVIEWTVGGKIKNLTRSTGSSKDDLAFEYDAAGNRVTKIVKPRPGGDPSDPNLWEYTHYVRDASGNIMAVYKEAFEACGGNCEEESATLRALLSLEEHSLYGSDRLGTWSDDRYQVREMSVQAADLSGDLLLIDWEGSTEYSERMLGDKTYELKNHLGNVVNTVSDMKIASVEHMEFINNDFSDGTLQDFQAVNPGVAPDVYIDNEELVVKTVGTTGAILLKKIMPAGVTYNISFRIGYDAVNDPLPYPPALYIRWEDRSQTPEPVYDVMALSLGQNTYSITTPGSPGDPPLEIWIRLFIPPGLITEPFMYRFDDFLMIQEDAPVQIADVTTAQDYYPFGMPMPGSGYTVREKCVSCSMLTEALEEHLANVGIYPFYLYPENVKDFLNNYFDYDLTYNDYAEAFDSCGFKSSYFGVGNPVEMDNITEYNVEDNDFSLEAWVKVEDHTHGASIISTEQYASSAGTSTNIGFDFYANGGKLYFHVMDGQGDGALIVSQDDFLIDSEWHHVAAVRIGNTAGDFELYADGVQVSTTTIYDDLVSGDVDGTLSDRPYIGINNSQGSHDFEGFIRDVRWYMRALDPQEVEDNYEDCTATPSNDGDMVMWFKLDEGSGTVAYDYSEFESHGEMGDAVWLNLYGKCNQGADALCAETTDLSATQYTYSGRSYNNGDYRYGFNGKEMDNEVSGNGNQYDYGFRIYNPRLGRFLSTDPLQASYPELTPYQFASNTPVWASDLDGLEAKYETIKTGDGATKIKVTIDLKVRDYTQTGRSMSLIKRATNIEKQIEESYRGYDSKTNTYYETEVRLNITNNIDEENDFYLEFVDVVKDENGKKRAAFGRTREGGNTNKNRFQVLKVGAVEEYSGEKMTEDYQPETGAHEIGHALIGAGHKEDPENLMSVGNRTGTKISPEQLEKVTKNIKTNEKSDNDEQ